MITRLNLDDKRRKKILDRKALAETIEVSKEKPVKKDAKKNKKSKVTNNSGET